jgi:hypothetical protein
MERRIELDETWLTIEYTLRIFEEVAFEDGAPPTAEVLSKALAIVYVACTQKPPRNWSGDIYHRFSQHTKELAKRRHTQRNGISRYARCATGLLKYLNRFYVKRLNLPEIEAVVNAAFDAAAAGDA